VKDLPLLFTPRARADLDEAACVLNARRPGEGEAFIAATEQALAHVTRFPLLYAEVKPNVRHLLISRYPYIAYYRPMPEYIEILGILHTGHNPKRIDAL
jgi:plasmid stabilization system protein ParE